VIAPLVFYGNEELYRFLLPASDVRGIREKDFVATKASEPDSLFLVRVPLDSSVEGTIGDGSRVVGKRLTLRDHYTAERTYEILKGNIANNVFAWDLLLEPGNPGGAPAMQN
ncbi:MAG: hypothetical protein ACKOB0_03320, partial [Chthoniobacterales bacterium]